MKTDSWHCSIFEESFSRTIKNGNVNATGDRKINTFSYYAVIWGGFAEDTSNSFSPCFTQTKLRPTSQAKG